MIRKHTKGSALLAVLLLMTITVAMLSNFFRSFSLTTDLIFKRQRRMQRKYLAHGTLYYGLSLCKKHYKTLQEKVELDLGAFLIDGFLTHHIYLVVTPKKKTIEVKATLRYEGERVYEVCCTLENSFITKWSEQV